MIKKSQDVFWGFVFITSAVSFQRTTKSSNSETPRRRCDSADRARKSSHASRDICQVSQRFCLSMTLIIGDS